jgi:hypothetical protein
MKNLTQRTRRLLGEFSVDDGAAMTKLNPRDAVDKDQPGQTTDWKASSEIIVKIHSEQSRYSNFNEQVTHNTR